MKDSIVSRLLDDRTESISLSTLDRLSAELSCEFQYPNILIYLLNHREACLQVKSPKGAKFEYKLHDRSLATKVFHDNHAYFCPDPLHDLYIHFEGIKRFGIKGPVLGVPLRFGDLLVGVVVLWGKHDPQVPPASEISEIERFVTKYVTGATGHEFEIAMNAVSELRRKLIWLDSEALIVKASLQAMRGIGLDRARVFRIEDLKSFSYRCVGSVGDERENQFQDTLIRNCKPVVFAEPDGKRIVQARRFDPLQSEGDPNAELLLKPAELPYVNVPLWCGQDLVGCLAGDNKYTQNRITKQLHLESLDLIAALVAPLLHSWRRLPPFSPTK